MLGVRVTDDFSETRDVRIFCVMSLIIKRVWLLTPWYLKTKRLLETMWWWHNVVTYHNGDHVLTWGILSTAGWVRAGWGAWCSSCRAGTGRGRCCCMPAANQRSVFRSRDQSRPIRGQYSGHVICLDQSGISIHLQEGLADVLQVAALCIAAQSLTLLSVALKQWGA